MWILFLLKLEEEWRSGNSGMDCGITPHSSLLTIIWSPLYARSNELIRRSSYVASKPPNGPQKRKMAIFRLKSHFAWRKSATKFLCVKTVSDKVVRHSPAYNLGLRWRDITSRAKIGKSIGVILGGYEGYAYPPLFKVGGTVPPTFKRYKSGYFCLHLVT